MIYKEENMDNQDNTNHTHDNNHDSSSKNKKNKDLEKIESKINKLFVDIHTLGELIRKQDPELKKEQKENLIKSFDKQLKVFKDQLTDVKAVESVKLL